MLVHKRHEGVQFKPEILPVGHDRVLLIQRKAFLLKAQPLGTSIPGEPGAATGRFFQYLPYFFKANDSGWGGEVLAPNERNKRNKRKREKSTRISRICTNSEAPIREGLGHGCDALTGLERCVGTVDLGLRSSDSLQPRLSHWGLSAPTTGACGAPRPPFFARLPSGGAARRARGTVL